MPTVQFPKVKLGFLKKLLPRKSDRRDGAVPEPATITGPDTQQEEKIEAPAVPLEECPICHDPVGVMNPEGILESWVHLHCNHKFGTHCIQTWLQESAERDPHSVPSCPICRTTAKHPCGHPIVLPARRFSPITMWSPPIPSPPGSPFAPHIEGRPRRRLSRRWGHPNRPDPPPPVHPYVQTVGECTTCAAIAAAAAAAAAREKRMKQSASPTVEVGGTTYAESSRTGIKSRLRQTGFRGRSNYASEGARGENYRTFIRDLDGGAPASARPLSTARHDTVDFSFTGHRDSITLCRTEEGVPRSPTPIPPVAHVLSTRMELAHI